MFLVSNLLIFQSLTLCGELWSQGGGLLVCGWPTFLAFFSVATADTWNILRGPSVI